MEKPRQILMPIDRVLSQKFVQGLLKWNTTKNKRQMPWKGEKDPYKIWLSEIILQQTRVEQGLKYYERFINSLPTIHDLAKAPETKVFKLWEGLGYYSRCRNLIATAKFISNELNGVFPSDYASVLALKGVGPYTAAAITSFAYNLPYAVLDGNVFRVLARAFDIEISINSPEGKGIFSENAQKILPVTKAGEYNQAIMDFGATICKPAPECAHCFFNKNCKAFLQNKQLALPVKGKKMTIKDRWFHYFILRHKNLIAIQKRNAKDIWQDLHELVLIEGEKKLPKEELLLQLEKSFGIEAGSYEIADIASNASQRLSHQLIHFSFFQLNLNKKIAIPHYQWISKTELTRLAFPKTLQQVLAQIVIPKRNIL
jgi:A/G-specific adenine glycosylase